jgi:hypothetical protein
MAVARNQAMDGIKAALKMEAISPGLRSSLNSACDCYTSAAAKRRIAGKTKAANSECPTPTDTSSSARRRGACGDAQSCSSCQGAGAAPKRLIVGGGSPP